MKGRRAEGAPGGGSGGRDLHAEEARDRLVSFSDGVFAVAITVLALTLEIPGDLSPVDFRRALHDEVPSLTAYAFSFGVVSSFWLAHHRAFLAVRRVNRRLILLNLALLGVVVLIPFPTQVLGEYGDEVPAVMLYAGTVGAASLLSLVLWWYASRRHRLIDPSTPDALIHQSNLRGGAAAVLFLVSIPLALVSTDLSKYCWIAALASRLLLLVVARRQGAIDLD